MACACPDVVEGVLGIAIASVDGSEAGIASVVRDIVGMELDGLAVI